MAIPTFMLCENEQADLDGEYLLHTKAPRFLARRIHDNKKNNFEIVDDIDQMLVFFNNDTTKVEKLLSKMQEWYFTYQKYLDDQYGEED